MDELGESTCNECGGVRVLIFRARGIFSKCKSCGMVEWEWGKYDNPDYLGYLAEVYDVATSDIHKELVEREII